MSDLELEARLTCRTCNATPYLLYRRRNRQPNGQPLETFEHQLWPATPDVAPPERADKIVCPKCSRDLVRVAA